jgi:predicted nucleic acid-binding protein
MITAIDTNVIVGLWDSDDVWNRQAAEALRATAKRGRLVVSAPVYSELLAQPKRAESLIDEFLESSGIDVEWVLDEKIWRMAGQAYQEYAARRKREKDGPRRILADFLIGAHAARQGYSLLTFDDRIYRAAFPGLSVISL